MGKNSKLLPVLLTPDMVNGIDVMLSVRPKYIPKDSEYLFAVSKGGRSTTGWDALKAVVKQVPDLQNPDLITSTKLRKYLATMSQVGALANNYK